MRVVGRKERREREQQAASRRPKEKARRSVSPKKEGSLAAKLALDPRESWLYSHLYVRVISKEVGDGAFYRKKGVITDVIEPGVCSFQSDDRKILHRTLFLPSRQGISSSPKR